MLVLAISIDQSSMLFAVSSQFATEPTRVGNHATVFANKSGLELFVKPTLTVLSNQLGLTRKVCSIILPNYVLFELVVFQVELNLFRTHFVTSHFRKFQNKSLKMSEKKRELLPRQIF